MRKIFGRIFETLDPEQWKKSKRSSTQPNGLSDNGNRDLNIRERHFLNLQAPFLTHAAKLERPVSLIDKVRNTLMSDFQDFLTHAIAHVVIGEFQMGKFEQAQQVYQEAVSTFSDGFRGAYLLREKGTDRGISVIFWDSEDRMQASNTDAYQTILKKMDPLFIGKPQANAYEVVTEILPES